MVTDATAGICIIFSMFFFPSVRPEMFGGPRRKGMTHVDGRIDHLKVIILSEDWSSATPNQERREHSRSGGGGLSFKRHIHQ